MSLRARYRNLPLFQRFLVVLASYAIGYFLGRTTFQLRRGFAPHFSIMLGKSGLTFQPEPGNVLWVALFFRGRVLWQCHLPLPARFGR